MPLDALDMTQLINDDHTTEKPSECTVSMRVGVGHLKGINKEIRTSNFFFNQNDQSKNKEIRKSKVCIYLIGMILIAFLF